MSALRETALLRGRGDWDREVRTSYSGWRMRLPCLLLLGALLIALGVLAVLVDGPSHSCRHA